MLWQGINRHAPLTILLVEDEETLRLTLKDMLESLGFQVIVAYNGNHAIRLVTLTYPEFHLVLSDFRMPGINGVETIAALRKIRPGLKAILCSGTPEQDCLHGLLLNDLIFLGKPHSLQELHAAVNQALG